MDYFLLGVPKLPRIGKWIELTYSSAPATGSGVSWSQVYWPTPALLVFPVDQVPPLFLGLCASKSGSSGGILIIEIKQFSKSSDRTQKLRELEGGVWTTEAGGIHALSLPDLLLICFKEGEWVCAENPLCFLKVMELYLGFPGSNENKHIFDEGIWAGKVRFLKSCSHHLS